MEVLFIAHDATRAGAQMLLLHLLRWLVQNSKLELKLVLREDGPLLPEFESVLPTKVLYPRYSFPGRPGRFRRNLLLSFPQLLGILPKNCRLIYSNTVTNGAVVERITRAGIPVLTHVHEMGFWINQLGDSNWKRVKAQSSRMIAASHAVKRFLTSSFGVAPERIDVVHEFIRCSEMPTGGAVRRNLGIPDGAFVVVGSGYESWRKGRDLFVQLAAAVSRRQTGIVIHFVWIGSTRDAEDQYRLAHDASLAGVASILHWTGEITNVLEYFAAADLFAMVSREDPFPLVCLEAALMEKPIVCFEGAGGIPELVEEDCGFAVPYLDVQAMADRVIELASDASLLSQLGARAREKVLERHTVDVAGPKVLDIMHRTIREGQR